MEDFAARLEALERKAQRDAQQQPEQRPPLRLVKDEREPESGDGDDATAEDVT
jgi:hypothetical protein